MRWFMTDFKRAITERSFFASVGLGIVSLLVGLISYLMTNEIYTAREAFITSHSMILPFIAPVLATVPYSSMSMLEKDTGFERLMRIKGDMKQYTAKRFVINGLVAGLALLIPLLIHLILCRLFSVYIGLEEILIVIGLDFLFGVSYGCIAYGLTFVNTKRYIPIVAPQVMYLLFIYAFPYLELEQFYPPLAFAPWLLPTYADLPLILLQFVGLIGVAIVMVVVGVIYKKVQVWR